VANCLPPIDYGITFDSTLRYDSPWIVNQVNEVLADRVVMTVHVHGDVQDGSRERARRATGTGGANLACYRQYARRVRPRRDLPMAH